jgi:hypothetical protein
MAKMTSQKYAENGRKKAQKIAQKATILMGT